MVKILHIGKRSSSLREIVNICVEALNNNNMIAIPTETVYGIVVPDRGDLFEKLCRIKGRQERFTIHASDISQIVERYDLEDYYIEVLKKLFPGPVTAVVETLKREKIGLRVPDHELVREILKNVGPVFMPSANRKDSPSPITGRDVLEELSNDIDMIIDEGYTRYCIDSTVIDLTKRPPEVLRCGAFSIENLEKVLDMDVKVPENIIRLEPFPVKKYLKSKKTIILRNLKDISKIEVKKRDTIVLSTIEDYEEYYKVLNDFSTVLLYGSKKDCLSMFRGVYECFREIEKFSHSCVIIIPPELTYDTLPVIERFLRAADLVL
ncbi:MAG: L-threonylcarbamoyladenylate synthase [Crenarchaeota archaeon]|nr:L-threonylcarbamoyladenylate synthase [Thermoproteota archaeon]